MPRPRFHKLSEERRRSILDRASAEFVKHGYQGASLNRLLEAAELSKGSFYYYFDDRDDLFGAVLEHEMHFEGAPDAVLGASDAPQYWSRLEDWVEGLYADFLGSPRAMSLARELTNFTGGNRMPDVVTRMMEATHVHIVAIITAGQRVGAVRTDLPDELLVATVMKLGEALDHWTASHLDQVATKTPAEMRALSVPLFRRLLQP